MIITLCTLRLTYLLILQNEWCQWSSRDEQQFWASHEASRTPGGRSSRRAAYGSSDKRKLWTPSNRGFSHAKTFTLWSTPIRTPNISSRSPRTPSGRSSSNQHIKRTVSSSQWSPRRGTNAPQFSWRLRHASCLNRWGTSPSSVAISRRPSKPGSTTTRRSSSRSP